MRKNNLFLFLTGFISLSIIVLLVNCASTPKSGGYTAEEWYTRGGLNIHMLNNYQLAIEDFSKALELDPNHYNAYMARGRAYLAIDNMELAVADFSKAINLFPMMEPEPYAWRGLYHFQNGNYTLAREDFEAVVQIDPDDKHGFTFTAKKALEEDIPELENMW